MKKANANDAAINSKAFGPIGNVIAVDDQVLTLLDQLVAMKLLVGWEDRAPSQRHYTIGKRLSGHCPKDFKRCNDTPNCMIVR